MLRRAAEAARLQLGKLRPQLNLVGAANHYGPAAYYLGGGVLFYGGGLMAIGTSVALKRAVGEATIGDTLKFLGRVLLSPLRVPSYNIWALCYNTTNALLGSNAQKEWLPFMDELAQAANEFYESSELKKAKKSVDDLRGEVQRQDQCIKDLKNELAKVRVINQKLQETGTNLTNFDLAFRVLLVVSVAVPCVHAGSSWNWRRLCGRLRIYKRQLQLQNAKICEEKAEVTAQRDRLKTEVMTYKGQVEQLEGKQIQLQEQMQLLRKQSKEDKARIQQMEQMEHTLTQDHKMRIQQSEERATAVTRQRDDANRQRDDAIAICKQKEHALTQGHERIQQLEKAVTRQRDDVIARLEEQTRARAFIAEQKRVELLQLEMTRASTRLGGNEIINKSVYRPWGFCFDWLFATPSLSVDKTTE